MDTQATEPSLDQVWAALATLRPQHVERVISGGSTWVYRVSTREGLRYLRVLPEAGASFAPEALAHVRLSVAGVRLPQMLGWEAHSPLLGRSTMLTAELPGRALAEHSGPLDRAALLAEAGRDLARVNGLSVTGFGWVVRDPLAEPGLRAPFANLRDWLDDELRLPLAALASSEMLGAAAVAALSAAISELAGRVGAAPACLAHGDLDPTHIFVEAGRYSGLIDFGEIRGAHQCYDLGHFAVGHSALLPQLLVGYADVGPLPTDAARQIALTVQLIAARRVGLRLASGRAPHPPDLAALQDLG